MKVNDLFRKFPRCVGLYGDLVYSEEELNRYVEVSNGVRDTYVCLYDTKCIIDKIFLDIDSYFLDKSFEAVKKIVKRLESMNIPYIPVFSGKKGFHIYIPTTDWVPPNIETAKVVLRDVQESIAGDVKEVDKHVFGDVKRKVRYPNTLNGNNYATPLPLDFTSMSLSDIVDYAKTPHDITYDVKPINLLKLTDVELNFREYEDVDVQSKYDAPVSVLSVLRLLRPCVADVLLKDKEPPHLLRVDLVAELRFLGFTEEQVVNFIRLLGWQDFDEKITRYQVSQIFRRGYLPLTCRRLQDFVEHRKCLGCNYFYWWGVYKKPW